MAAMFLFACFGLTFLVRSASLTEPMRSYFLLRSLAYPPRPVSRFITEMLRCSFCTATWASAFLAGCLWDVVSPEWLIGTLAGAGATYLADRVVVAFGQLAAAAAALTEAPDGEPTQPDPGPDSPQHADPHVGDAAPPRDLASS
jgi:hypothetical protein